MRPLEYQRASTVDDAVRLLAADPYARFLGGGTNLVDLMKYGVEEPSRLVDIGRLPLTRIEPLAGGGLRIDALVRNSDLAEDPRVVQAYPVLSQALLNGASPQLRNMSKPIDAVISNSATKCSRLSGNSSCAKRSLKAAIS